LFIPQQGEIILSHYEWLHNSYHNSIIGRGTKTQWKKCEKNFLNNNLYKMITSYEKFHEWILNCCNILDFQNVIKLHHNPYHMIMDSTYLLKCFIDCFFTWKIMWCHWYKGGQFWRILMIIIWKNDEIWFLNKLFY
jgi:uncharacterized protein (DUF1919 family)